MQPNFHTHLKLIIIIIFIWSDKN